jgi:predicted dehydrogenase
MVNWLDAARTIASALDSKRIGTPVFARIVADTGDKPEAMEGFFAKALDAGCRWIGAEPTGVTALGAWTAGQVTALVEFARGQTALVSVGTSGASPPLLETYLVGTSGIASWEPGGAGDVAASSPAAPLSDTSRRVLDAARKSLAAGRPVRLRADRIAVDEPSEDDVVERPAPARAPERRPKATPPPYGVLLIAGSQTHQENYAQAFQADPRCRLVGVADEPNVPRRRRLLNERLARKLKIPLLPDLDRALGREDAQIASVVAVPERRARLILRCAEAAKHLYLDKPMAASAEEAAAVVRAIEKAGVVGQMFSQVRSAVAERLRRLVHSGSLGELKAIHLDLTFAKGHAGTVRIDGARRESVHPERFETVDSKRELFNVGVYPLVLLEWLLGRPVRRVRAVTANYFFAEHRRNDMEDFAAVLLELEGGLVASLAVGRTGWRSHRMGGLNRACVMGTKGTATVDAYRPRWEVWADEIPWLPPRADPDDPMGFWKSTMEKSEGVPKNAWLAPSYAGPSDVMVFLDCIQNGKQSDVSAQVAAASVCTLMAAYRSAATGRTVSFAAAPGA